MVYRTNSSKGISLVEVLIASSLVLVGIAFSLKSLSYLQDATYLQGKLSSKAHALRLAQDVAQSVREAKAIRSISSHHLDLETYNFSDHSWLDRELYETRGRVQYSYSEKNNEPVVIKEIFTSTDSAQPKNRLIFMRNQNLLAPTPSKPLFFPSFVVGGSTRAVQVEVHVKAPDLDTQWVLAREEVFIHSMSKKENISQYPGTPVQKQSDEEGSVEKVDDSEL